MGANSAIIARVALGTPSPACSPAGGRRGGLGSSGAEGSKERELRRTPRGGALAAPGAPAPEGAWLAALGIVDEVLQDSLVLQGRLYVRVVDRESPFSKQMQQQLGHSGQQQQQSSSSSSSSSVVTAAGFANGGTSWNTPSHLRRFTNARNTAVLEFYVPATPGGSGTGPAQEEKLDGTIDLRTVQGVHYLRPRSVTALAAQGQARARLTQFAVETPGKVYELEAASEAEAVYWVLGLKRIVLSPGDGVPAARTPRTTQLAAAPGAGTLAAADADVFASPAVQRVERSALMLRVTQAYLQQRMDEVSEELGLVEHTLRDVGAYAARIHQQYFALTRRKALLQHTRDELHSYSEEIEARLASSGGGGSSGGGSGGDHNNGSSHDGRNNSSGNSRSSSSSSSSMVSTRFGNKLASAWEGLFPLDSSSSSSSSSGSHRDPPGEGKFGVFTTTSASVGVDEKSAAQLEALVREYGTVWRAWQASGRCCPVPRLAVVPAAEGAAATVSVQSAEAGGGAVGDGRALYGLAVTCYPLAEVQVRALGRVPDAFLPNERELAHVGDPICDQLCAKARGGCAVAALADGCNWGRGPRNAARCAAATFAEYVARYAPMVRDTKRAADVLLAALAAASDQIAHGRAAWETGTTTMAGGVLLRCARAAPGAPDAAGGHGYVWVGIGCGDCRVLHYTQATGTLADITPAQRTSLADASDPGGRLGPHLCGKYPDLRNLGVAVCLCDAGDLVALMSDGVTDNFDPQHFGHSPQQHGLPYASWDDAAAHAHARTQSAKAAYMLHEMLRVIRAALPAPDAPVEPETLVRALVDHVVRVTASSRKWMCENPKKKLPHDYVNFPGKLDHTSCLCLKVGAFDV